MDYIEAVGAAIHQSNMAAERERMMKPGCVQHDCDKCKAKDAALLAANERIKRLEGALLNVARMAEALKRPCGFDPETPQAIRNGEYMSISYAARAALKGERHD